MARHAIFKDCMTRNIEPTAKGQKEGLYTPSQGTTSFLLLTLIEFFISVMSGLSVAAESKFLGIETQTVNSYP